MAPGIYTRLSLNLRVVMQNRLVLIDSLWRDSLQREQEHDGASQPDALAVLVIARGLCW